MTNDTRRVLAIPSALFATLLFGICILYVLKQFSYQGTSDKLRMIVVLAYLAILTILGWLYVTFKKRLAGFIHAVLMFGIAGLGFYGGVIGLQSPLADNPSAGILAAATLISFILGVLAAICGISMMFCVFKKS
ncbi:MAG: hypothetical protein ACREDS_00120 [Limisphaerales bacterium]